MDYLYTVQECWYVDDGYYGGGGGSNPPTDQPSPTYTKYASKILNCSKLTIAEQKKLEQMIEKIMDNCMGGPMYNGLVASLKGQTLSIGFDPNSSSSTLQNGTITIGTKGTDSEALFHELFHVYQGFGETKDNYPNGELNREVEAWCADYMYSSKQPGFETGTLWHDIYLVPGVGTEIKYLAESLNSKGQYYDLGKTEGQVKSLVTAFREYPEYTNNTFDENRSMAENLRNIQNLAKNC